jgi:DNA-binding NarL/FixJ family response regulator
MKQKIKVILIDDHAVVRAGFKMLLSMQANIEVVAEGERGEQACQLYLEHQPDVMVLDLSMPGIGGLEALRRVRQREANAKILILSVHDEMVYVQRAIDAGAQGYISKHTHPEVMITAIEKIAKGERYFEQGLLKPNPIAGDYKAIIDGFSPREFDIFLLLAKGLTAHKIADELCLSYKTVANYGTQIRSKLNVASVAELAHIALVLGLN